MYLVAFEKENSIISVLTFALRRRLQCLSRPAAVTWPAQPPPASLPRTAPALASPGSRRLLLSLETQWEKFNRPNIFVKLNVYISHVLFYFGFPNHNLFCSQQVSPSKSQGFGEQRSQTIAVLSSPPRATTSLRYCTRLALIVVTAQKLPRSYN